MKKIASIFVLCMASQASAFDCGCGWEAEFRTAAVYMQSKLFREIYSSWEPEYQVELTKKSIYDQYDAFVNVGYMTDHGKSRGLENKTHFRMVPVTFGVKYDYPLCSFWDVYVGVGVAYSFINIHDESPYVQRHISKHAWGVVGKFGAHLELAYNTFLDLFADYLAQQVSGVRHHGVEGHSEQVGGLRLGAGIGVKF